MICAKVRQTTTTAGRLLFHLEEEKSKTRVFGYGHGDHIRLKDEYGNVWQGSKAIRNADSSVVYRFRDPKGQCVERHFEWWNRYATRRSRQYLEGLH